MGVAMVVPHQQCPRTLPESQSTAAPVLVGEGLEDLGRSGGKSEENPGLLKEKEEGRRQGKGKTVRKTVFAQPLHGLTHGTWLIVANNGNVPKMQWHVKEVCFAVAH